MGVWGAGLYSGDFAADLRATIRAVVRLPFEPDKLVEILTGVEPGAATEIADEDYTTFWLVVADQFAKNGIACEKVRVNALRIIHEGIDLALMRKLGMAPALLTKRAQMLAELRERIEAAPVGTRRAVLKHPQPLLMDVGDVFAYPTSRGKCINSYYPAKERIPNWQQDGWGVAVIVDSGRAFDFLAWYRPITIFAATHEKPTLEMLQWLGPWILKGPGTCNRVHFKRLELEKIGSLQLDPAKMRAYFPQMKPNNYQAINDISIANELSVKPNGSIPGTEKLTRRQDVIISNLDDLLA